MIVTLCEKCPNTEFFLVSIFPHSDQKNFAFGHFSRNIINPNGNELLVSLASKVLNIYKSRISKRLTWTLRWRYLFSFRERMITDFSVQVAVVAITKNRYSRADILKKKGLHIFSNESSSFAHKYR